MLILEDEYLIARETEDMLRAAGATVVGPFSSMQDALEAVEGDADVPGETVDCAIVDLNLGSGPTLEPARMLAANGTRSALDGELQIRRVILA